MWRATRSPAATPKSLRTTCRLRSMPALSPAEVSTAPSSTKSASRSTATAGKRAASSAAQAQWVAARRPSSSAGVGEREGAGADREQPGAAVGGGAQGVEQSRGRRLEQRRVAGDDDRLGPLQGAEVVLRGDPEAAGGRDRGAVDRAGGELVVRLAAGAGGEAERLRRRGQVEGDDAVEAEGDDAVHGRNLANIGIPASGKCDPQTRTMRTWKSHPALRRTDRARRGRALRSAAQRARLGGSHRRQGEGAGPLRGREPRRCSPTSSSAKSPRPTSSSSPAAPAAAR